MTQNHTPALKDVLVTNYYKLFNLHETSMSSRDVLIIMRKLIDHLRIFASSPNADVAIDALPLPRKTGHEPTELYLFARNLCMFMKTRDQRHIDSIMNAYNVFLIDMNPLESINLLSFRTSS